MNKLLYEILDEFKKFPQVKAVAIGGSSAAKTSDETSDIDVYVFVTSHIPVPDRDKIIRKYSSKYETGGEYFGSGDEFFVDEINQQLDVMYWNIDWFNAIVENVWFKHYPSNGYSTAFLYTLKNFNIIYDTENFLKNLQDSIETPYPTELRKNIIHRNIMLLKDKPFASYYEQIKKAVKREDLVSVNHRIAAFLASYFDIIFAVNELLHPGEKRLVSYCKKHCSILPKDFEQNIDRLLIQPNSDTLKILDEIIINLKSILHYCK